MSNQIKDVINDCEVFAEKIKQLRTNRIKYFNCALEQNLYNIKKILEI